MTQNKKKILNKAKDFLMVGTIIAILVSKFVGNLADDWYSSFKEHRIEVKEEKEQRKKAFGIVYELIEDMNDLQTWRLRKDSSDIRQWVKINRDLKDTIIIFVNLEDDE